MDWLQPVGDEISKLAEFDDADDAFVVLDVATGSGEPGYQNETSGAYIGPGGEST